MEPLSAVSLASAVIQIVEFSSKVLQRTREIHTSADRTLRGTTVLEAAAANLNDLLRDIEETLRVTGVASDASGKAADAQLIALAKDSQEVAKTLHATLHQVKRKKDGDKRNAFSQGLRSVLKQSTITALKDRLNSIRKQIDTALLISLRQNLSQRVQDPRHHMLLTNDKGASERLRLLTSLQHHNWKPTKSSDLSDFSDALRTSVVSQDIEARFASLILSRLWFTELPDRYGTIPEAHQDTFHWMFEDDHQQLNASDWDSFTEWLSDTDGSNLFWISGKPGSGKSTLMKYLFSDDRTTTHLQAWTSDRALVQAGFFFWNSGSDMQMSRMGLLQTLLHYALRSDRKTLMQLFEHRWQQFVAFGGGRQPFTWLELRRAFDMMISAPLTPRKFFFMIDGLDEFDGDRQELVKMILMITRHLHVKICVASRPWPDLLDAFEGRPSLRLERLTQKDIQNYVTASFANNKHYAKLSKLEPNHAANLIKSITKKAAGVFLWVYLVLQSLLDGLSNADRMCDLMARLEALPPGLEQLFLKLLGSLDPDYLKHACQLFRLVMVRRRPLLLELWFADSINDDPALRYEARFLSSDEVLDRLEMMNRRLIARCKGFLEVEDWRRSPGAILTEDSHVSWIHRTARDFLRAKCMWNNVLDTTGHDDFDPEWHWANGHLGMFKAVAGTTPTKMSHFILCVEYALRLEHRLQICPVKYLDEVGRTATIHHVYDAFLPRAIGGSVASFLEFSVLFQLVGYVKAKGATVPRRELKNAARLQGLLDAKQWESLHRHIEIPAGDAGFVSSRKELDDVLNRLLGTNDGRGWGSKWQRTKERFLA
ncbi:hypothetical protein BDW02DRAFT_175185 [Decorospora gaudefroyi]|uniref:Uncharacterized protein n=1 Tax=Decorospora gaudefroyi TaxID=184978 RepID=A0A6A5KMA7_9PLEO|nr:hypothetical protein BDW02DRAFT_175185 [Decorospora gaudefroyi]